MLKRWNRHIYDALRGLYRTNHFHNSIRRYGKDSFSHEVLEVCDTLAAANAAEERWISHFDSTNQEKGFNIKKGGAHTPHPVANHYRSDPAYLESQRLAAERRWKDPEYRTQTLAATQEAVRSPEVRKNIAAGVSALWQDLDYRASQTEALKARAADPVIRQKLRDNWDDPDFRERCSSGPRAFVAAQAAKTRCVRGHEYTPENTVLAPGGHRECKTCNYARKKAARTACPKGHPYEEGNVLLSSSGRRMCAVCLAESKIKSPCRVCGSPKDMLVSGRLRCRPCGNRRALESRKRASFLG